MHIHVHARSIDKSSTIDAWTTAHLLTFAHCTFRGKNSK